MLTGLTLLTRALAPTGRALPRLPMATVVAATAAPPAVAWIKDGTMAVPLALATVVAASALAYAAEDDAGDTLACSPTPLVRRRAVRLAAVGAWAAVGWLVAVAFAATDPGVALATARLGAVALACAGVAAAAASACAGRSGLGARRPGYAGVMVAAGGALASSAASVRYPWLPTLADEHALRPWLEAAAGGWAAALWLSRDPARRLAGPRRAHAAHAPAVHRRRGLGVDRRGPAHPGAAARPQRGGQPVGEARHRDEGDHQRGQVPLGPSLEGVDGRGAEHAGH